MSHAALTNAGFEVQGAHAVQVALLLPVKSVVHVQLLMLVAPPVRTSPPDRSSTLPSPRPT